MSNLIVPPRPKQGRSPSASNFAEAFDAARRKVDDALIDGKDRKKPSTVSRSSSDDTSATSPGVTSPPTPATPLTRPLTPNREHEVVDDFAFAFDIDGVLIRGGEPIPQAIEAMKMLNGENEYRVTVPYIFLTNGGGKTEEERCKDLSAQLELDVSPGQFICGHTPMREMATKYKTVLVVGGEGEKCRDVAKGYGFRDVITPGDILRANSATAPFRKLTDQEHTNSRDLLLNGVKMSDIVIEAIFVFADSRDWAGDLQIMLDIATSQGGRLETRSETFEDYPPIYFSHNDVLWSSAHEHARLGMGALRKIVEVMFEDITGGKKLKTHAFGKPQVSTFEFATRLLQQWRAAQHGMQESKPPRTVYFVGDTPESDIQGTNAMNEKSKNDWYSILVKTGVYQDGTVPAHEPRVTVPTVLEAVKHGIDREMERRRTKEKNSGAVSQKAVTDRLSALKLTEST